MPCDTSINCSEAAHLSNLASKTISTSWRTDGMYFKAATWIDIWIVLILYIYLHIQHTNNAEHTTETGAHERNHDKFGLLSSDWNFTPHFNINFNTEFYSHKGSYAEDQQRNLNTIVPSGSYSLWRPLEDHLRWLHFLRWPLRLLLLVQIRKALQSRSSLIILRINSIPEMCHAGDRRQDSHHLPSPKLPFLEWMNCSVLSLTNHLQ